MMDNFVCRAEKARREYNGFGYAQEELLPGELMRSMQNFTAVPCGQAAV